jgi:hypothetical protein
MREDVLQALSYWIREREEIREAKAFKPKPWTNDPILQNYKFCNVHREDDHVTKWFALNWRHPKYWDEPNFIAAIMLGRTINWPDTLSAIGFPVEWKPWEIKAVMDKMMSRGQKVYTGAYMITAGPTGVSKNDWVLGNAKSYFENPPKLDPNSIQKSWETIIGNKYPCVGPFIAGQIIADLKHTRHLRSADDWWNWAAVGPGSMRGLNRIHGRPITFKVRQEAGLAELIAVRKALDLNLCLQDVQNCLCELDKYLRVKNGEGLPRSGYNGRA